MREIPVCRVSLILTHILRAFGIGGNAFNACLYFYFIYSHLLHEYALLGANARWGRGRSRFAGYPSSQRTSDVYLGSGATRSARVCIFILFKVTYFTSMPFWGSMLAGDEGNPGLPGIPHPNARLTCIWDRRQRVDRVRVFILFTGIYFTSMLFWEPMLAGDKGDPGLLGIPHPNARLTCCLGSGADAFVACIFIYLLVSTSLRLCPFGANILAYRVSPPANTFLTYLWDRGNQTCVRIHTKLWPKKLGKFGEVQRGVLCGSVVRAKDLILM